MGRIPVDALDCPNGFLCLTGQVERARLFSLSIERNYDEYMDSAELEEDELKAFRDGDLVYYWVRAKAEIQIPSGFTSHGTCWFSQEIASAGVGGIGIMVFEDDSRAYLDEVESEELDSLKDMLQILNVELDNWDAVVDKRTVCGEAS